MTFNDMHRAALGLEHWELADMFMLCVQELMHRRFLTEPEKEPFLQLLYDKMLTMREHHAKKEKGV